MAKKRTKSQELLRLNKVPVQAYLEKEQAEALKELSNRKRVPQQVYIREGVAAVLALSELSERAGVELEGLLREGIDMVLKRYSTGFMKLYIEQRARALRKAK